MAAFGGGSFASKPSFGQPASGFGGSGFGTAGAAFGGQSGIGAQPGSLFGSQPQSFSAFSQPAPLGSSAFGAQSAPAFGAAFGSSGFGAQSAPAFGTGLAPSSSGAFGANQGFSSSSSLFGSGRPPTGAFGASTPFGQSQIGQSQGAWGQSSSGFGGASSFASGAGLFGHSGPSQNVFGQNSGAITNDGSTRRGTAGLVWQTTTEYDAVPGEASKYQCITMMNQVRDKSLEELRVEDYAIGNTNANSGQQGQGNSLFGSSGNPQPGGLFGNPSAGFAASSGSFGANSVFGNTANFGGQQSSGGAANQQTTGGLFSGGGAFGGASGFGQSSGIGFASGGAFGAQSSGSLFAQPGAAFGGTSGGGFGSSAPTGFGSSGPSLGANNFAQPSSSGGGSFGLFGMNQPQSSFGPGNAQSGGGLFASSGQQQQGGSLFGGGLQPAPQPLAQGNTGQQNLFGGSGNAPGFSVPNANAAGAQSSLFGSTGGVAGFGTAAFGASAPGPIGGSLFGGAGQGASASPFGMGSSVGLGQPQPIQSGPGVNSMAQGGYNPTLQGTYAAVTQQHGATVAPPGSNYGTVLYNLQKLQSEIGEHKRHLEHQAKQASTNPPPQPGTVSVVVLPPPGLIPQATSRGRASSPVYGWSGSSVQRTKTRSVVGRLSGTAKRLSGTPARLTLESADEDLTTPTSKAAVRRMSIFSPQHFTGVHTPRMVRASELETPVPTTTKMLPFPRRSGNEPLERNVTKPSEREHESNSGLRSLDRNLNGALHGQNRVMEGAHLEGVNGSMETAGLSRKETKDIEALKTRKENGIDHLGHRDAEDGRDGHSEKSGLRHDARFMWSQEKPSSWSMKRPADSDDQFNPHRYIPSQTKPGFYTKPSIADLSSRTMAELQHVENFTVGRIGYGRITWLDPVDVRGLDVDKTVDIRHGEVAVYPEYEARQLDAPAKVVLEGMFRRKKNEPGALDTEAAARYTRKLQKFCDENNLRFIAYDAAQGEWAFEVHTFAD